jgi:glycosyltransferase involved in cell wall biosynthesis
MTQRPFRLLVVSHAADGTGAPISTLALTREWAKRSDVEVKVLLRRDGPLRPAFDETAETFVFRLKPHFGLVDAIRLALSGQPFLALKGLRNPDRPYILSAAEAKRADRLRWAIHEFEPDAIYVSTTHCGDALEPMRLTAPMLTHVREMKNVITALDAPRRDYALRHSSGFAAVSEAVSDTLVTDWGVDPALVQIEHPAIDVGSLATQAIEPCAMKLPDRPFIIGVGSLIERKGPDLFLELAARSKRQALPYHFIWLGDGPMAFTLQEAAEQMGVDDVLTWAGQVENPYTIIKQAQALALTSREDPHPRTMIEAAALSVPTVAFQGAGGADIFLANYEAGQCVPMEDAAAMLTALETISIGSNTSARVREDFATAASATLLLERLRALSGAEAL